MPYVDQDSGKLEEKETVTLEAGKAFDVPSAEYSCFHISEATGIEIYKLFATEEIINFVELQANDYKYNKSTRGAKRRKKKKKKKQLMAGKTTSIFIETLPEDKK